MAARSFLKRAPNHVPNHNPPNQFQMLAAWYYISFFLVHGIPLIEIGARFKNNLTAIIRNKERGPILYVKIRHICLFMFHELFRFIE